MNGCHVKEQPPVLQSEPRDFLQYCPGRRVPERGRKRLVGKVLLGEPELRGKAYRPGECLELVESGMLYAAPLEVRDTGMRECSARCLLQILPALLVAVGLSVEREEPREPRGDVLSAILSQLPPCIVRSTTGRSVKDTARPRETRRLCQHSRVTHRKELCR